MGKIPNNIMNLQPTVADIKKQFLLLKKEYKQYLESLTREEYWEIFNDLPEVTRIANKVMNFPGDISPNMLAKLADALNKYNGDK